jgi:VIT1/CCC1 family predicted Fe2+/Mn2+ transporter
MEKTEMEVYTRLANREKNPENKIILEKIAEQENNHYNILKEKTGLEVKSSKIRVYLHVMASIFLGLTFSLKLMEKVEQNAAQEYRDLGFENIAKEEDEHEKELLSLLEEDALNYLSSIILGLSDALIELTGVLAGLTLAFQDLRIVALAGLVTGISASFSMAASEFLATKEEDSNRSPSKAALFTGMAYIITVFMLVIPYLMLGNDSQIIFGLAPHIQALVITFIIGILIIALFNFYVSVAQDNSFNRKFIEMIFILSIVTIISFLIGWILRESFGL